MFSRSSQQSWLYLYALLIGMGEGSRSAIVTSVASDMFPGESLGGINGAMGAAFGAGAAALAWVAGRIYDISSSYSVAFQIAAFAIILSAVALFLAPKVQMGRARLTEHGS